MTEPDKGQLQAYVDAGWQLIPLHHHDYQDAHKGKTRYRGKSPVDKDWTRKQYFNSDVLRHAEGGKNVGVRLRMQDLVVDVDPRNFDDGDDPFKRLCEDVGLEPLDYPVVETGSGGLHVYMTKPDDVSIRDSLPGYPGVEFKTYGRQVVAAGSVHPETKRLYAWDPLSAAPLSEAPGAPTSLLTLVKRPARSTTSSGGGEHTKEELAEMLDQLDPEDFRDHDRWLQLMQASHHATAGDGRDEFVEWSTRDPEYSAEGTSIGRRWDSLHADADGGRITHRTLHKFLLDAGRGDAIPRKSAADDFAELDGPIELPDGATQDGPEHEQKGPLERMNDRYWAVMDSGKFVVMWEEDDPTSGDGRRYWNRASRSDFMSYLENKRVMDAEGKAKPAAETWLKWGRRRSAHGVVFDPERDHPGRLNLWTGWAFEPRKKEGGWDYLNELVHEVLCDGDEDLARYVLDWAAYMVQHPSKPAEVAVAFQGSKGVGKGTWGRALARLAGRHGMQITSSEHITGRFNSHLRDVVLLFADEALNPRDKDGESRLKGLITEPMLTFEGKGQNAITGRNHLHVVMASNEDWFVPMGLDGERRFLVAEVNARRQGQRVWFEKLNAQLEDGGHEALLFDLMARDIAGFHPSRVPQTQAGVEQKIRNMSPMAQWWFEVLSHDAWPWEAATYADGRGFRRYFRQDLKEDFAQYCARLGVRPWANGRGSEQAFGKELVRLCPDLDTRQKAPVPDDRPDVTAYGDGRGWCYELPPIVEARSHMERALGGRVDWEPADEEVDPGF